MTGSQGLDWKLEKQGLYVLASIPLKIVNSSVCPFYALAVVVKIYVKYQKFSRICQVISVAFF